MSHCLRIFSLLNPCPLSSLMWPGWQVDWNNDVVCLLNVTEVHQWNWLPMTLTEVLKLKDDAWRHAHTHSYEMYQDMMTSWLKVRQGSWPTDATWAIKKSLLLAPGAGKAFWSEDERSVYTVMTEHKRKAQPRLFNFYNKQIGAFPTNQTHWETICDCSRVHTFPWCAKHCLQHPDLTFKVSHWLLNCVYCTMPHLSLTIETVSCPLNDSRDSVLQGKKGLLSTCQCLAEDKAGWCDAYPQQQPCDHHRYPHTLSIHQDPNTQYV